MNNELPINKCAGKEALNWPALPHYSAGKGVRTPLTTPPPDDSTFGSELSGDGPTSLTNVFRQRPKRVRGSWWDELDQKTSMVVSKIIDLTDSGGTIL